MKAKEIRELTDEDLTQKIADTRQALTNLRFQHALGQLENTAQIQIQRRELARLLTIQRERQLRAKVTREA
ncbi:MAG: 50S ribosomal protein L29 [bacterium]